MDAFTHKTVCMKIYINGSNRQMGTVIRRCVIKVNWFRRRKVKSCNLEMGMQIRRRKETELETHNLKGILSQEFVQIHRYVFMALIFYISFSRNIPTISHWWHWRRQSNLIKISNPNFNYKISSKCYSSYCYSFI